MGLIQEPKSKIQNRMTIMQSFLSRMIRLTAIAFLPAGVLVMIIPNHPAAGNQFSDCVRELNNSGVPGDQVGTACADALKPTELSSCVRKINKDTLVPAEDALKACFRVRRPKDLANCVVDIHRDTVRPYFTTGRYTSEVTTETLESSTVLALDSCRRSLLPKRHSKCVVGLSGKINDMSPAKAMETCLDAEDFPRDLFPAYTPD
ncbi:MAG: hypothetical protein AB4426_21355 [Xenococcaceae cyanobacterium]